MSDNRKLFEGHPAPNIDLDNTTEIEIVEEHRSYPELEDMLDEVEDFLIEKKGGYSKNQKTTMDELDYWPLIEKHLDNARQAIRFDSLEVAAIEMGLLMYNMGRYFTDDERLQEIEVGLGRKRQQKAGEGKAGHEGRLKQCVRDVVVDGAKDFDSMLLALEDHPLIPEIDGDSVTYLMPDETLKTVKLQAVKKAYREIIKNI